jgi:hypothetical protein
MMDMKMQLRMKKPTIVAGFAIGSPTPYPAMLAKSGKATNPGGRFDASTGLPGCE